MRKLDGGVDVSGFHQFNPLGIWLCSGQVHSQTLCSPHLSSARLPVVPDRHGMAGKFHQTGFARFNRQFIWLATRGRCLICSTLLITGISCAAVLACHGDVPDVRCASGGISPCRRVRLSDQLQRVRRAIFDTGRTVFRPAQRSHLCAVAFTFPTATGSERFASYQMDRPPRRIYSQSLLLIDLNAVINVADCAIRALRAQGASSQW